MATPDEIVNAVRYDLVPPPPIQDVEFHPVFEQWLCSITDVLNNYIASMNPTALSRFTTEEITELYVGWPNGSMVYDVTTNQIKAKVNGAMVVK